MPDRSIVVGAASRPYPGELVNGDACSIHWHNGICRVAIIDGLGHGAEAAAASQRACDVLNASPELGAVDALLRCHRALAGTRGAAAGVICIDSEDQRVTYAGVGNIAGHLCTGDGEKRFVCDRGIVGAVMPRIHPTEHSLTGHWTIALHSDGIHSRLTCEAIGEAGAVSRDPYVVASRLLGDWARSTDDATIVVISPRDTSEE